MVRARIKSPEEVEKAKAPVAEAATIAVTIVEATWLQINIYLEEKWKAVRFPN